ncbi:MAG: hypothetical protein HMLKMBBP_03102 [Planctomycetes bacterium]|nr:hypothetical protein [Planctomycetota bacterium]
MCESAGVTGRNPPPLRTCALLFAAALAVRAALLLSGDPSAAPVEDERGYAAVARAVAEGRGFELSLPDVFPGAAPRTSFRAPLWPAVLAPVAALGGGEAAFRWTASVIGAACAPLLFVALQRTTLARFAWIPAAALALWPTQTYTSVRILSEPLATALTLGALATADSRGGSLRRGALLGLAVLARPAALPAAALVCLATPGWGRRALAFAACAAAVAPWVARNASIHGRPLLTTNSGVTLVGGNSAAALAAAHPGKWVGPDAVYAGDADAPDLGMWGWSGLGEAGSDRRFSADAVAWISAHPADAATLAAWKAVRFVDPDTRSGKADAGAKRLLGWLTWFPAILLAGAGLAVALRRDRSLLPMAALLGGTFVTCLVFYADARMRSPAEPAVLAFATAGALALLRVPRPEVR